MFRIVRKVTLLSLFFALPTQATEYKRFDDLPEFEPGSGITQSLVLCDAAKFLTLVGAETKKLLLLPKPVFHQAKLDDLYTNDNLNAAHVTPGSAMWLFINGAGRRFGMLVSHNNFQLTAGCYQDASTMKHVGVVGLHDSIAISYRSEKRNIQGLVTLTQDSFRDGLWDKVKNLIPQIAGENSGYQDLDVTITTSFCTPYLENLLKQLKQDKFNIIAADVGSIYLTCDKGTASGTKYVPISTMGLKPEHMARIKDLDTLVSLIANQPYVTDFPKSVLIDINTGHFVRCLNGFSGAHNGFFLTYLLGGLKGIPYSAKLSQIKPLTDIVIAQIKQMRQKNQKNEAEARKLL